MKTAAELYPEHAGRDEDGFWCGPSSYQPIIENIGTVAVQVDDQDYQGDSRVLYSGVEDKRWGLLIFGWGSCSGCDSLQACDSMEQVQSLMDDLAAKVIWWDTTEKALEYFETHDWRGDWSWSSMEMGQFIERAKAHLRDHLARRPETV